MFTNPFDAFAPHIKVPPKKTALVYDPACERHEAPEKHPECPDRVKVPLKHLSWCGLIKEFVWLGKVQPCTRTRLLYAHDEDYVDCMLEQLKERQNTTSNQTDEHGNEIATYVRPFSTRPTKSPKTPNTPHISEFTNKPIDMSEASDHAEDMYCNEHTHDACLAAAGGAVQAALAIASGKVDNALCILRPPGHHAGPRNASGFCMFNNVAVAARTLQREAKGMRRIVIFDWDVHHGDGTEKIFYDDPSVLCISIHQYAQGHPHRFHRACNMLSAADTYAALTREPKRQVSAVKVDSTKAEVQKSAELARDAKRSRRAHASVDYSKLDERIRKESEKLSTHGDAPASRLEKMLEATARGMPKHQESEEDEDAYDPEEEETSESSEATDGYDTSAPCFYPGTGRAADIGSGRGRGYNINIPLPCHRFGDTEYLSIMQNLVLPLIRGFEADCIIIAGGFDAVQHDTLGNMELTPGGYAMMTQMLMDVMPHGRVLCALEGGYNVRQVALCVEAVARTLLGSRGRDKSRMLVHRASTVVDNVWTEIEKILPPKLEASSSSEEESTDEDKTPKKWPSRSEAAKTGVKAVEKPSKSSSKAKRRR